MPVSFGFAKGNATKTKRKLIPSAIPTDGLQVYLDAGDPNSYPGAGNTWFDLSGNGRHGVISNDFSYNKTSGGGALQLTAGATGNVQTASQIVVDINLSTSNYTIIGASRYTVRGNSHRGRTFSGLNNNWLMGHWSGSTQNYFANGWVSSVPTANTEPNDIMWRIYTATGNYSGDSWAFYSNNNQIVSNSNGVNGPNKIVMGRAGEGGVDVAAAPNQGYEGSKCEIGFFLVWNRVLSEAERTAVYDYFKNRFVVQDSSLKLHLDASQSECYSGSGTTLNDLSVNSNTGTLTGGVSFNSSDKSFTFDGVDDYINFSSGISVSSFTYETWIYHTPSNTANNFGYIFSGLSSFGGGAIWGIAASEGGTTAGGLPVVTGDLYNYDGETVRKFNYILPATRWVHLAFVADASANTISLYVNGAFQSTISSVTYDIQTIKNISRFDNASISHNLNGKIASARLYNTTLTAAQITQNYNASKTQFYPDDLPSVSSLPNLWLKADGFGAARNSSDQIIRTDNTKIAKMFDYSGFQNHAIQNTSNVQPSYRSAANGIGGKPAIQFSTSNLQVANFTRTAWTTFVVFKCSSDTLIYEHGTGWDQPGGYLYTNTNSSLAIRNAANTIVSWRDYTAAWGSDNVTKLAVQRFNGTNASHILRVNGTQVALTDRNAGDPGVAAVTATLNIGGRNGAGIGAFYLCELIMFNAALSDADVEKIELYLRRKWGLV